MDFTVYIKEVGGRHFERYYKKWDNAKKELDSELAEMIKKGWTVTNRRDRFNEAKGFYEYDVKGKTSKGEDFTLFLAEECFQD